MAGSSSWINLSGIKNILKTNPAYADEVLAEALSQNASPAPQAMQMPNNSLEAAAINAQPSQEAAVRSAGMSPEAASLIVSPNVPRQSDKIIEETIKQQMAGYEKLQKDLEDQRRGVEDQSSRLASMLQYQPPQRDISGTIMALDAISGMNQASKYKRPDDYYKNAEDFIGMQDKLQQRRKDLTSTEADLLKQKLSTKLTEADKKDERQMRSMNLKMEDKLTGDVDKNIAKPLNEYEQKVTPLEEVVKRGKISEIRSMATNFARVISGEKGVVTDADANRAIAETWADRFGSFIARAGSMTDEQLAAPETRKVLEEMIQVGKEAMGKSMQKRLEDKKEAYETSSNYSPLMREGAVGSAMFKKQASRISEMLSGSQKANAKNKIEEEMRRRGLK